MRDQRARSNVPLTGRSRQVILGHLLVIMCQFPMSRSAADQVPGLPAAYVTLLLDVVKRWNISDMELLSRFDLDRQVLTSPTLRIPLETVNDIYQLALELTEEPGLPFYLGMQMKLSSHGFIGFAAMTADTLAQALELAERFISLRMMGFSLRVLRDGDTAHLYLETDLSLQPLRDGAVAALMVGLGQMGQVLTGETLFGVAELDIPENPRFEEFRYMLPAQIQFNRPANRISFAATFLELPLVMADNASMQLAVAQCERELVAIGQINRFVRQVRGLIYHEDTGFRSVEAVASELCMSERTLKRQLAHEGTTFSDILEDLRRQKAIQLLDDQQASIERIAECLGYSDVANFNRAFKRWTGTTPGQYRRNLTDQA
ncbi:AraC family transcriptional regulator [Amnimonas aquatica]|uniref:AraC family transcriptional regulator n=2 Tax=Amnimonas aquatica TaxID=2094561 RepID=A0A2P6AR47_9GAMM|nr:AraC family transcriptional regulator [Amnimonas aquatica]